MYRLEGEQAGPILTLPDVGGVAGDAIPSGTWSPPQ